VGPLFIQNIALILMIKLLDIIFIVFGQRNRVYKLRAKSNEEDVD
jgi:hypothetical protein